MRADWDGEVRWRPRDIVWSFLTGSGLGLVLAAAAFIVLEISGAATSGATAVSVMTIPAYAGLLLGAYLFVVRRRAVSLEDVGFVPVRVTTLVLMVPLCLLMLFVVGAVISLTSPLLGDPPSTSEQLVAERNTSLSLGETLLLLADAAIVAPFVEELFFRGLIYRYLRGRWGLMWGVVVSSGLFAIAHPYAPLLPAIFVLGAVLARVTERYRSLYPAVVLHALINGTAVLVLAAS